MLAPAARVPVALPDRAREQPDADAERGAVALEREEVLLGERLRRRHQRAEPPGLDRAQQRIERDDGLAGADVALEQPLHRHGPLEIGVDLLDGALLVGGQPEGQLLAEAGDELAGRAERRRHVVGALRPAAREPDLEDEQLVEGQPRPRPLRLRRRAGTVQRDEGVGLQRQLAPRLQLRGQRVGHVARPIRARRRRARGASSA